MTGHDPTMLSESERSWRYWNDPEFHASCHLVGRFLAAPFSLLESRRDDLAPLLAFMDEAFRNRAVEIAREVSSGLAVGSSEVDTP